MHPPGARRSIGSEVPVSGRVFIEAIRRPENAAARPTIHASEQRVPVVALRPTAEHVGLCEVCAVRLVRGNTGESEAARRTQDNNCAPPTLHRIVVSRQRHTNVVCA